MNKKRISQIIGLAVLILLFLAGFGGWIGLQLLPDKRANPPIVNEPSWDSPQTRELAERACFDCHSNETNWPWYSNIPPVSEIIWRDVRKGRSELNYSDWHPNQEDESIEEILKGKMPPRKYVALHPEARLSDAETKALIAGLKATFGDSIEGEHEVGEDRYEGEAGDENHEENDDDDDDREGEDDDDEHENDDDD